MDGQCSGYITHYFAMTWLPTAFRIKFKPLHYLPDPSSKLCDFVCHHLILILQALTGPPAFSYSYLPTSSYCNAFAVLFSLPGKLFLWPNLSLNTTSPLFYCYLSFSILILNIICSKKSFLTLSGERQIYPLCILVLSAFPKDTFYNLL